MEYQTVRMYIRVVQKYTCFKIKRGSPKFVQIREITPHKKFQLDRLRIGRANPLLSFRGIGGFLGGQNNISYNNFDPYIA